MEVTLVLGKWQRGYFEEFLGLGELKTEVLRLRLQTGRTREIMVPP